MTHAISGIIIPLSGGSQNFNDQRHVTNFMRYLLSLTAKHPTTAETALNYIRMSNEDSGSLGRANKSLLPEMESLLEREGVAYDDLTNDLIYWVYAIRLGNRTLSNFVTVDNEGAAIDGGIMEDICKVRPQEEIIAELQKLLVLEGDFVSMDEATPQERVLLETHLEKLAVAATGHTPLIHVSHNDQGLHHTHRIIRRSA